MSVVLLILGILTTGAGIVAIGFGVPINEFNLGNTLILAGTIAAATGLILIGLAAAVEQLTRIARAVRPRAGVRPVNQPYTAEQGTPAAVRASQFPLQPAVPPSMPAPVPGAIKPSVPSAAAPSRVPAFVKPKAEERIEEPAASEASAIDRLRSNLTRSDRRAERPVDADEVPSVAAPPAPSGSGQFTSAAGNSGSNGAAPPPAATAAEPQKKPPLDFLFRPKSRAPQTDAFDAAWPKRGQRRPEEQIGAAEVAAPGPTEASVERPTRSEAPPTATPAEDLRPPAILKSGMVDGMAYTLYADGSIEAQLPQGTVRFGSIAELRSHIENNS